MIYDDSFNNQNDFVNIEIMQSCDEKLCVALKTLTKNQLSILINISNGYTEFEIASSLGITQQGVNSAKKNAILKIKKSYNGGKLL